MKVFAAVLALFLLSSDGLRDTQTNRAMAEELSSEAHSRGGKPTADISRDVVDTTVTRLPTAGALGQWEYSRALFLMGVLSVYRRTHDPSYLAYAKAWADSHIDEQGTVNHSIDALDFIMPGNVPVSLYQITGDKKYMLAADKIANAFETYPRTSDGGWWHAIGSGREHQLWGDGVFMALPFLVRQGELSGHAKEVDAEAVHQLLIYSRHLRDPNGSLFFHAYDESGKAVWANPANHNSRVKWARAIGWYSMTLVDVLDTLPKTSASKEEKLQREQLIAIAQKMAHDLVSLQDPNTGLWFQIIDKPELKGNFVETSSSSMFTYFLDVAVKRGYIDSSYKAAAEKGYRGVLSKVVLGEDGHYHVSGICEGTNVGDQESYLERKVYTDDFHGLGAFLLMNEEVRFNQTIMQNALTGR